MFQRLFLNGCVGIQKQQHDWLQDSSDRVVQMPNSALTSWLLAQPL
jgi:hypothetical protein